VNRGNGFLVVLILAATLTAAPAWHPKDVAAPPETVCCYIDEPRDCWLPREDHECHVEDAPK
jgi:hypothetical protein